MYTQSELEFGKLGYEKYEKGDIIVYFKPYPRNDIRYDDITFCKRTKKIILYQGTNYGPDAFRTDYRLINAIKIQCEELNWNA